jgi:hypothetical protein
MTAGSAPLVPRGLILGVVTIVIGLVFLADSLTMLDAHSGWALWPLAVIVAGMVVRLQPGVANQVTGIFLLVAGVWLLFNGLGIWTYAFWRTWPLILILLGVWMWIRTRHMEGLAASGQVGAFVFLSQVRQRVNVTFLQGGELSVLAGDGTFDLGLALRGTHPIVIDALVVAGRLRIAVPADWVVETRVLPLPRRAGDMRGGSPTGTTDSTADLIVRGSAILGVVEVVSTTATPVAAA